MALYSVLCGQNVWTLCFHIPSYLENAQLHVLLLVRRGRHLLLRYMCCEQVQARLAVMVETLNEFRHNIFNLQLVDWDVTPS